MGYVSIDLSTLSGAEPIQRISAQTTCGKSNAEICEDIPTDISKNRVHSDTGLTEFWYNAGPLASAIGWYVPLTAISETC